MVYGIFYLPIPMHTTLLADTHHFDDSKVLTPAVRSELMQKLCTPSTDLFTNCGWATSVMSARDIASGMLKPNHGSYNLNAQAMDATIELIKGVFERGINVKEIYVDTIGRPETYQKKLERIFPTVKITVAKKADSLYPCVSAASVCAKVTRDAALEVCYESYAGQEEGTVAEGWGSGYPSDARTTTWLKKNMHPAFGWGPECRFSWGTVKDLMEQKNKGGLKVDWPLDDEEDGSMRMTDFFSGGGEGTGRGGEDEELVNWYGRSVGDEVF
jgi:ribonuclease H2 subunit A